MVTATVAAGISVIGVGLLLIIVGLAFLVRELSKAQKDLEAMKSKSGEVQAKGIIGDMGNLVEQINKLIEKLGAAKGIPMAIMIFGVVLVGIGAAIVGVSV